MSGLSEDGILRRVTALASITWTEAVRQRFFAVLLLLGMGVVLSATFFREFNFGYSEIKFVADFGFGGLNLFGSILAIVGTAQLYFNDIESRAVLTILAKPVRRSEFILGKFAGIAGILLVYAAGLTVALCAVLWWRERAIIPAGDEAGRGLLVVNYGVVWLFAWLHSIKFLLLAAITLFVGSYARTQLFTVICGFVILVIGHLQPLARAAWSHSESLATRFAGGLIAVIFPSFQLLNLGDAMNVQGPANWSEAMIAGSYGCAYAIVILMLAMFSFSRREV